LKLVDVPIILIVDGTQTSIPDDALVGWKAALIVKGFEKEFSINGPTVSQLLESNVLYIAVHDVPILYDQAGNITRKDNFEWTFQIKKEEVSKNDKILYSYDKEPVEKKPCYSCNGTGASSVEVVKCYYCDPEGSGYVNDKNGKRVKCTTCNGTGKRTLKNKCYACDGSGIIEDNKSPKPPIQSEVIWTGWKVNVETNPPGANVSVVDINTGEYKNAGNSNIRVDWFSSSSKSFPIVVMHHGKQIKVLPFKQDGKESPKVYIDYTSGNEPSVLIGRKAK
jgi:hypothetical protein